MLTENDIELKAQQYLQFFQLNHQQNTHLLKQLQTKLNTAAKIIQYKWRLYIRLKKIKMAIKIQSQWRKYCKIKLQRQLKIQRFKLTFYKGKIAYFILTKYFPNKLSKTTNINKNKNINQFTQTPIKAFYSHQKQQKPKIKSSITTKIQKHFPQYIALTQTYKAQQKYIQKLRLYQKQKFSSMWQKYQQTLKTQLRKQATKKWVKKNKQIWINQQNKQVNLQEYIQRNVQKLFKRQYQQYKLADNKLCDAAILLGENVQRFKREYYVKLLQNNY